MKVYLVTKASDDGTFEVGDHIWFQENGDISCREAAGWIDKEDVEEATKGWEIVVDQEYINKQRTKLLAELEKLNETV